MNVVERDSIRDLPAPVSIGPREVVSEKRGNIKSDIRSQISVDQISEDYSHAIHRLAHQEFRKLYKNTTEV